MGGVATALAPVTPAFAALAAPFATICAFTALASRHALTPSLGRGALGHGIIHALRLDGSAVTARAVLARLTRFASLAGFAGFAGFAAFTRLARRTALA